MYVSEECTCLQPHFIRSLSIAQEYSHLPESHNMDLKVLPIFTGKDAPSFEMHSVDCSKRALCSRGFFFSGTFGKPLRRPHLDAFSSSGQSSDCQPRAFHLKARSSPNLDYESEEDGKERTDFQQENHTYTHKQTLESHRTSNFQSFDLDT